MEETPAQLIRNAMGPTAADSSATVAVTSRLTGDVHLPHDGSAPEPLDLSGGLLALPPGRHRSR